MKIRSLPLLLAIAFFGFAGSAYSRDINLDAIYINTNSSAYTRLIEKKLDAYRAAQSQFIARDVIFAVWKDGITILYIREVPELNVVFAFNRNTRSNSEVCRLEGMIVAVKSSASGKFLFIKRLRQGRDMVPFGEMVVLNTATGKFSTMGPSYPFIDFSVAAGGNAVLMETRDGIEEFSPDAGSKTLLLKKSTYSDIVISGAPSLAYYSPNGTKALILCGSGGSYRSKLINSGSSLTITGMTSASEICWISNNQLIYRTGGPGNYSLRLYDSKNRRSNRLADDSLNTNLQFSSIPKMVTFLKDQVIQVYDVRQKIITNTCLEGEDVLFSPDGNRFISLYLKKLFIANFYAVKKNNFELIKNSREILELYRKLQALRTEWANEFTGDYLRKKVAVYRKITD